jgi:hypothetical protein
MFKAIFSLQLSRQILPFYQQFILPADGVKIFVGKRQMA